MGKNIQWINIARGLGILLVVIGHVQTPETIKAFIYSFHMPLFFFLSGYVFNPGRYNNVFVFASTRIRKLIIPYIFFAILTVLIFTTWPIELLGAEVNGVDILKGFMWSTAGKIMINAPLWFLTCLFVVQIVFYLIVRFIKNKLWIASVLILSSCIGYLYSISGLPHIPWNIDVSLTAVVFFGIGYLLKGKDFDVRNKYEWATAFSLICALISYINSLHGRVDMFSTIFNDFIMYYSAAFCGIAACVLVAKIIDQSKLLSFIGENSIYIFTTHIIVVFIINFVLAEVRANYFFEVYDSMEWMTFYTVITMLISIVITVLIKLIKYQGARLLRYINFNKKKTAITSEI